MQSDKTVESAFDEFILFKQNENLAQASINDYNNIFGYFMDFCGRDKPIKRYQSRKLSKLPCIFAKEAEKAEQPQEKGCHRILVRPKHSDIC